MITSIEVYKHKLKIRYISRIYIHPTALNIVVGAIFDEYAFGCYICCYFRRICSFLSNIRNYRYFNILDSQVRFGQVLNVHIETRSGHGIFNC